MSTPWRVLARIFGRVTVTPEGCWRWPGATTGRGYGQIGWHENGAPQRGLVHRLIYEAINGEIPAGMQVDHRCHDPAQCHSDVAADCPHRRCCNPFHLVATTCRQNVLRSGSFAAENAVKTTCPSGHPYDDANTYVARNGWRQCRECRSAHIRAFRQRRQVAVA